MSGRNLEDFFQDTEAFDALSDEDRARLFAGETIEGETKAGIPAEDDSGAPAAATVTEEDPAAEPTATDPEPEPEPTVLAKDGKHTIPFSELEAARERARQLEQELLALKATPPAKAVEAEPTQGEPEQASESNEDKLGRLRSEWREAMYVTDTDLAAKLEKEIDALNRQIAKDEFRAETAAQEAERKEKESQETAVSDAIARANALTERYPFLKPDTPQTNHDAIDLVVAQRDKLMAQGVLFADAIEQAVAKVAPLFDKGSTTQLSSADAAKKAAEAVAKAKSTIPNSLSEAPAGTRPHHDESEALRAMDTQRLALTLESKSPEEIMRIMAKAL